MRHAKNLIQLSNFNLRFFHSKLGRDIFKTLTLMKQKGVPEGEVNLSDIKMGVNNMDNKNQSISTSYSSDYLKLIQGNKEYVAEKTANDPDYFKNLAKTQKPKYCLIGCSDSRVPPNEMTKTDPGEIFIHRNIANQVISSDLNCMSVIQYAVEYLKVDHVIVMGHTKCGGVLAANKKIHLGLIDQWLTHIKDIAVLKKEELLMAENEEDFVKRLIEINVKVQALNACKTPWVQKAWREGRNLHVHGWLMDIETGLINDLTVTNKDWSEIKNIHNLIF